MSTDAGSIVPFKQPVVRRSVQTRLPRARWILLTVLALATGCAQLPRLSGFGAQRDNESKIALARMLEGQGQEQQAKAIYESIISRDPANAVAAHRLAVLAAGAGKHDEAERYFSMARARLPNDADLLNDMGFWLYMQGRLPEAEATLRQALEQDPKHKAALNNLGLVVGEQGRLDESLNLFQQVTTAAGAYQNLAFVCAKTGQTEAAERFLHEALALDPQSRPAAEGLLQIAQLRSRARHANIAANLRSGSRPLPAPGTPANAQSGPQSATAGRVARAQFESASQAETPTPTPTPQVSAVQRAMVSGRPADSRPAPDQGVVPARFTQPLPTAPSTPR